MSADFNQLADEYNQLVLEFIHLDLSIHTAGILGMLDGELLRSFREQIVVLEAQLEALHHKMNGGTVT